MQPLVPVHEIFELRKQIPVSQEYMRTVDKEFGVDDILREEIKEFEEFIVSFSAFQRFLGAVEEK